MFINYIIYLDYIDTCKLFLRVLFQYYWYPPWAEFCILKYIHTIILYGLQLDSCLKAHTQTGWEEMTIYCSHRQIITGYVTKYECKAAVTPIEMWLRLRVSSHWIASPRFQTLTVINAWKVCSCTLILNVIFFEKRPRKGLTKEEVISKKNKK